MDADHLRHWLQLTLSYQFDAARLKRLRQHVAGNIDALRTLHHECYCALDMSPERWPFFAEWQQGRVEPKLVELTEQALVWSQLPGNHIVVPDDADYPPLLATCTDAPPQLFVRGDAGALSLPQVAIVGSRKPTADGRRHARKFAAALVECGYLVTSGLALGIDAESHAGALEAGGRTVAVLGSGLCNIYPKSNTALAERITQLGALVSEFPPDAVADHWHFPERNRIISGLAHGVLVVEAAEQSGSLITARLASTQGREVFAIPGSINNPLARGCHRLLRQGAKLVESIEDILEEVPALVAWEHKRLDSEAAPASASRKRLPKAANEVLEYIGYDPVSLDALAMHSRKQVAELLPLLTQLELSGVLELRELGYVRSSTARQ